jgi:hypothetical protein
MNVTDPVGSFPALPGANNTVSVSYGDVQYSSNCTTQLQAIALDRQAPSVKEASVCGDTVSDIESSLKSSLGRDPNDTDLVILGTTHGNFIPSGFDTTSLGGTNYSQNFLGPLPQEYMIIGVPGAAAGSAHESYDVQSGPDTPFQYAPFLDGTLVLDQKGNYNYVPSDERAFQAVSNATSPSINLGGQQYTAPSGGTQGAFWLFVVDRELLQPINYFIPFRMDGLSLRWWLDFTRGMRGCLQCAKRWRSSIGKSLGRDRSAQLCVSCRGRLSVRQPVSGFCRPGRCRSSIRRRALFTAKP